jgi:glucan phosphoethanolaminetransferase (alkaline phosphatase superfamily)
MRSEETRKDILALDLPRNVAKSIQQYRKEEESFLNAQADGQWKVTSVDSKYRNYVIVVGESVRRDYMSVYGFDQKTTPFADQANGLFINGYVAPGPNTFTSVPRTLAEVKGDSVIYGRNLVTLARNADFRTYWLSNQGFVGEYDSPSSRLAASADVVHFTKLGSSDSGKIDDLALLEQLKAGLSDGTVGKRRMFVMHLMGSHPSFCERVKGEDQQFTASSASMRCYMGSIKHTDSVLAGAYAALRAAGEPFSLIYLGDHGLRHLDKGTAGATAVHAEDSKQSYAVPFFILSSDATAHIKLNKDMSGINFVKGAAQWMGIRAEGLPSYDFTTEAPDQQIRVFHSNGYQDYSSLKDDPV